VRENSVVALDEVRYDSHTGLVPVVVQDRTDGTILMLAYANREALKRTLESGYAWFWSRSRGEYWQKGATSGNVQRVREVRIDCDGDAILYLVDAVGPACHTGNPSCFFRTVTRYGGENAANNTVTAAGTKDWCGMTGKTTAVSGGRATDKATATGRVAASSSDTSDWSVLEGLWQTISSRWRDRPEGSYTTYLFSQGVDKVAKKVGEESAEVVIAAKNAVNSISDSEGNASQTLRAEVQEAAPGLTALSGGQVELAAESADLLYHLFALWKVAGIGPDDVLRVLAQRAK
jgi:phosphoribosyl-ATP pyrophosphohydrolase/phosphoribosyl-AMP cyclohydrolase